MRIAFFWTPAFAADILEGILSYEDIEVVLAVSQMDKPVGRKRELLVTPVKQVALNHDIEVLQPSKIRTNEEFISRLHSLNLDFIVVVAYGKIIPLSILDIPKYGCINIHGSILPLYRGASPVQSAIKDGQNETGLTTMYMNEKMDEGDVLLTQKVSILSDDTSPKIFEKFIHIWPELLLKTLQQVYDGTLQWTPQNHEEATYCTLISREDGHIDFQKQTAQEIYNMYRAYQPWPWVYTMYNDKKCILEHISVWNMLDKIPWTFVQLDKKNYGIVCSDKRVLLLHQIKPQWKAVMDIVSFVNGNRDVLKYRFY